MAQITIRPTAVMSEGGTGTRMNDGTVGTASTRLTALNDNSDTTWFRNDQTGARYNAWFQFASFAIPTGAVVQSVQAQIRYSHAQYLNDFEMIQPESIGVGKQTGSSHRLFTFTPGEHPMLWSESATAQVFTGPPRSQGFDGQYLGKLLRDTAGARLYGGITTVRNTVWNTARIYDFALIVTYNERPTITLVQPTGVINVSRPSFIWTYNDPDRDKQVYANIRVFTSTQPDPSVGSPVLSEDVWTTAPSFTTTKPITPNGSYHAYVRAGQLNVSGIPVESDWAYQPFTVTVVAPPTPTVTATYNATDNGIHVQVTQGTLTGFVAPYVHQLQRSIDGGTTWTDVATSRITIGSNQSLTFWDYEVPSGVTGRWRARITGINGADDPITSAWSTVVTASMPMFTSWWLRDIEAPTVTSMPIRVVTASLRSPKPQTVGYGLDDTGASVTHDGVKGDVLALEITLRDAPEYDSFRALIGGGRILLAQDTHGRQWYTQPGDGTTYEMLRFGGADHTVRLAHRVRVELTSVEPPTG